MNTNTLEKNDVNKNARELAALYKMQEQGSMWAGLFISMAKQTWFDPILEKGEKLDSKSVAHLLDVQGDAFDIGIKHLVYSLRGTCRTISANMKDEYSYIDFDKDLLFYFDDLGGMLLKIMEIQGDLITTFGEQLKTMLEAQEAKKEGGAE